MARTAKLNQRRTEQRSARNKEQKTSFSKLNQATSFVIESSATCVAGMQHASSIFGEILDAKLFGHQMSRCWLAERTMLRYC